KSISFYMKKFADSVIDAQGLDREVEAKADEAAQA
ncbi:30S ribosomal protein S2, partial [Francisella tularensis subsp. holarctica]|nr:30S ribosomal protein S2 [Francisella tularensis subsp. holarctica]